MSPYRALLLALLAAVTAALLGVGAVALTIAVSSHLPPEVLPEVLMEQQPMRIRFKQGMTATMDAVRLEQLRVHGRVDAVLPVNETLTIPLRGRYRLHADFDQRVPVRMVVRHTAIVPVTTTAEIEATTQFQYAGAKQYRNVRFRARLPLQFQLQLPLEVHIETLARVSASVPLRAVMNQDLRVALRGDLRTRMNLDHTFAGARLGAMRASLTPGPGIVNIIVTRALLRLPSSLSPPGVARGLDPGQDSRTAGPNNDSQRARAARNEE